MKNVSAEEALQEVRNYMPLILKESFNDLLATIELPEGTAKNDYKTRREHYAAALSVLSMVNRSYDLLVKAQKTGTTDEKGEAEESVESPVKERLAGRETPYSKVNIDINKNSC